MPQTIQFEGQTHQFPDDFNDQDISKALGGQSQPTAGQRYHPQTPEELNAAVANLPENQTPGVGDYVKTFGRELGAIASIPAGVYHAFADPDTAEEAARKRAISQAGGSVPEGPGAAISRGLDRMTVQPISNAATWYKQLLQGKIPNAAEQVLDVAPEGIGSAAGSVLLGKMGSDPAAVIRGAAKTYNAGLAAGKTVAPIAGVLEGAIQLANKNPSGAFYSAAGGGLIGHALKSLPEAPPSLTDLGIAPEVLAKIKNYAALPEATPVPLKMAQPKGNPYSASMPAMEDAQSGTIAKHGYDPATKTMFVEFKNGKVYEHQGVPQEVYDAYKGAESQGSFHQQQIKGRYVTNFRGNAGAK